MPYSLCKIAGRQPRHIRDNTLYLMDGRSEYGNSGRGDYFFSGRLDFSTMAFNCSTWRRSSCT
jgi:hypothetical protein